MVINNSLPTLMKAVQVKDYGNIDDVITVEDTVCVPSLLNNDEYNPTNDIHPLIRFATKEDRKTHMIIQTLAVALSPVDCRVLTGKTRKFQGPPKFPYIPGGDCCGIVIETSPNDNTNYFQCGDIVAARFTNVARDGLAEYSRVSTTVCDKVESMMMTKKISPEEVAALASASPAVILADYVRPKERILILGAGGGIGSHFCQLARLQGASYICGVSKNPKRLLTAPLNCDDAIDYTITNIYECTKYQQQQEEEEQQFDTIYDLSCGGWLTLIENYQKYPNLPSIVKPANKGGRYITITSDTPSFELSSLWQIIYLMLLVPLWRAIWSRLPFPFFPNQSLPTFTQAKCLPDSRDVITRTLKLANEGKLKAVIHNDNTAYSMTTNGVRDAFRTLESRHGEGKIVIKVADLPTK